MSSSFLSFWKPVHFFLWLKINSMLSLTELLLWTKHFAHIMPFILYGILILRRWTEVLSNLGACLRGFTASGVRIWYEHFLFLVLGYEKTCLEAPCLQATSSRGARKKNKRLSALLERLKLPGCLHFSSFLKSILRGGVVVQKEPGDNLGILIRDFLGISFSCNCFRLLGATTQAL